MNVHIDDGTLFFDSNAAVSWVFLFRLAYWVLFGIQHMYGKIQEVLSEERRECIAEKLIKRVLPWSCSLCIYIQMCFRINRVVMITDDCDCLLFVII